jgi:hypothetical protein
MKHLKRFNESAFEGDNKLERLRELQKTINASVFTPKSEQVPLQSLYNAIIIKTQDPINTDEIISHVGGVSIGSSKVIDTRWILLILAFGDFKVYFYPDESSLDIYLKRHLAGSYINWRNNSLIGYNDINHAEIENILSDYGIAVDEMWGVPIRSNMTNRIEFDI